MIEIDRIYNEDCLEGMRRIPDGTVDLVVTDPPYDFKSTRGGGAFGSGERRYHAELSPMSAGFHLDVLDEMCRVCRVPNMYVFCSKDQVGGLLRYAEARRLNFDILAWHKTNPVPTCSNKYLSDTEYVMFLRGRGARLYGSYGTKRKWWVQPVNAEDKRKYGHPTVKPLGIVRQLVANSSLSGGVVLDPFIGSGTTAVAAMLEGRHYIGFETDKNYYDTACRRIETEKKGYESKDYKGTDEDVRGEVPVHEDGGAGRTDGRQLQDGMQDGGQSRPEEEP